MSPDPTDGWLVSRVREGDLEALGALYERHKALVFRTALAITRDDGAAEDILQEVFLRVCTYAGSIDTSLPLEPWLYRVTVNQAYSWISRARRWFHALHGVLGHWLLTSAPVPAGPAQLTEEQEWWLNLQRAIDALSPGHQAVVVLHYLEGLSLEEIAEVLTIPEGTVKSRLHYARGRLRSAMREHERRLVPEVAYDFT